MNGTNTEKKTSENTVSLKRRWKDDDIEGEVIGDQIDCDGSQRELIIKASEVSDDGKNQRD